jgi:predicted site-specific integrase-resolvase
MRTYSTLQAAKQLGITHVSLGRYVKVGKIPAPQTVRVGTRNIHVWTDGDIEHVRKLLPKIANGRKTRYQKEHSAVSTQQSGKAKPKKTKTKKR